MVISAGTPNRAIQPETSAFANLPGRDAAERDSLRPAAEAVHHRQQVDVPVGWRQRADQVGVHVAEPVGRGREGGGRRRRVPLSFVALARDAVACPERGVLLHRGPDETSRDEFHR